MTIPAHVPPFYAMLKDVGIDAGAQHPNDAERNNQTLQAIEGFKTEWFPAMKQFILEHDVTNIPTVLKGMTAWAARGGPPQERTAKTEGPDISDERIDQWMRGKWERLKFAERDTLLAHGLPLYDSLKARYGGTAI